MWTAALFLAGVLTGVVSAPALRALPEPADGEAVGKPPYATLATRRFAAAVAIGSLVTLAVLAVKLPPPQWVAWLPLATLGVLLVAIDAVTTWLPLPLTRLLWAATAAGAVALIALTDGPERAPLALRIALGAVAVGGFFWAFWWLAGGLGFGDVRLAPVLGAVAASVSWQVLVAALLLGTLLGAAHGLARHLSRRAGPFPYGPALLAGTFLGLMLTG